MANQDRPNGPGTVAESLAQQDRREPAPSRDPGGLGDFARRMAVAVLILAVAYLLWRGVHVLLLAFAGVLFAVFLSSAAGWLRERTGAPYRWALAGVVLLLVLLLAGLGWLLASRLIAQAAELSQKLPESLRQVREYLEDEPWGRSLLQKAPQAVDSLAQHGEFSRVTGLVSGVAGFLEAVVVVVIVAIFGAAEPAVYKNGLLYLVPCGRRRRVAQALDAVTLNLRWWLVSQLVLMVSIGTTTSLGLWLLGVPQALLLGVITGLLELIPYVGAWLAAVPAALIALLLGPWALVATLALYLALHVLEGYVLAPLVQRRAVHLPPALTLVAQVLLGELLGVLGLFVAAPLTVGAVVFLRILYVEDALGDSTVAKQGNLATADPTTACLPGR